MTPLSVQAVAGIAVGKRWLDACCESGGQTRRLANDKPGRRALRNRLRGHGGRRVVFEPTGRYHRELHQCLAADGCATILVRPDCARRFAQALGLPAKTDRLDAAVPARYGRLADLQATPPEERNLRQLKDLVLVRQRFVDDRADLGKLAAELDCAAAAQAVRRQLQTLDARIRALDAALLKAIAADAALQRRAEVLQSIPGIGPVNAAGLPAAMPELGRLGRRAAAALLGVAPCANDSGQHTGRRRIRGRRRAPRERMYMAAVAALRWNPPLRAFYDRLRARSKQAKVALVAVMRKRIVLADALLRTDRLWQPAPPAREAPA